MNSENILELSFQSFSILRVNRRDSNLCYHNFYSVKSKEVEISHYIFLILSTNKWNNGLFLLGKWWNNGEQFIEAKEVLLYIQMTTYPAIVQNKWKEQHS